MKPTLDGYLEVLQRLLAEGKRSFVIHGEGTLIEPFLARTSELASAGDFSLAAGNVSSAPPESVAGPDAFFVFGGNYDDISTQLLGLSVRSRAAVCAPITAHYYRNRPVFVTCVPKSGGHLLMTLLSRMGLTGPGDSDAVTGGSFYFLNGFDQHTEISALSPYHRPPELLETFFMSPHVFMHRDPREVAASLAFFLGDPPAQFLERPGISSLYHSLVPYFQSLQSFDERLTRLLRGTPALGTIRDFVSPFAGWLEMPNTVPIRFADLTGSKGGGSDVRQAETVFRLQLTLQVPGRPSQFTAGLFGEDSPTFRRGQVGSYMQDFLPEHIRLFKSLPQDFMVRYGYGAEYELLQAFELHAGTCARTRAVFDRLEREFMWASADAADVVAGEDVLRWSAHLPHSESRRANAASRVDRIRVDLPCKESQCGAPGSRVRSRKMTIECTTNAHGDDQAVDRCAREVIANLERSGHLRKISSPSPHISVPRYFDPGPMRSRFQAYDFERGGPEEQSNETRALRAHKERAPYLIEEGWFGFNLIAFRHRVYGCPQRLGPIDLGTADLEALVSAGSIIAGQSANDVKLIALATQLTTLTEREAPRIRESADVNERLESDPVIGQQGRAHLESMLGTALDTLRRAEQRADDLLASQRAAEASRASLEVELERAYQEPARLKTASDEALERLAVEHMAVIGALEQKIGDLGRTVESLQVERDELGRALDDMRDRMGNERFENARAIEMLQTTIGDQEGKLATATLKQEEMTGAVDQLQRETGELRRSLQLTIAERNAARMALEQSRHTEARAAQLLAQVGEQQSDLEARRSANDRLNRELSDAQSRLAREVARHQREILEMRQELDRRADELAREISANVSDKSRLEEREQVLREWIERLQRDLVELQGRRLFGIGPTLRSISGTSRRK